MNSEIFLDAISPSGDKAGILESDDAAVYFYLYDIAGQKGNKVLAAIQIAADPAAVNEDDVEIRWSPSQMVVGLFICCALVAAFDVRTAIGYGGKTQGEIPSVISVELET